MNADPNTVPDPGQQAMLQQHIDREVRLVLGDLAMSAVFARARLAELEQLLAARDAQITALTTGKPRVVKEG